MHCKPTSGLHLWWMKTEETEISILGLGSTLDSGCKFQFASADANFNPPDFGL
jgi:hypothetical protein